MAKSVVLSLPRLGVKEGGWEHNKEIYVISFASDLSPAAPGAIKLPETIAAYNQTLVNVVPAIQNLAALRYVVPCVSNVFDRIRPEQDVSLSGAGILLYPNLQPGGLLANHFVIVESDEKSRTAGKVLQTLLSDTKVDAAIKGLLDAAAISQPMVASVMTALVGQIPTILQKNRDDVLFAHSHSGFDFDNYGLPPGVDWHDYSLANDRAYCTLRVSVRES